MKKQLLQKQKTDYNSLQAKKRIEARLARIEAEKAPPKNKRTWADIQAEIADGRRVKVIIDDLEVYATNPKATIAKFKNRTPNNFNSYLPNT